MMKLKPQLTEQVVQNKIREIGINTNYWYPVAWADELKSGQVISVMIWHQAIALYRDTQGKIHALEDACPHKGIALHKGEVKKNHLVCPYHGWEFNSQGECVNIPYLPSEQKLPCAKARSYPVEEKYKIIWVFPGDVNQAKNSSIPEVPEYEDQNWLVVYIPAHFQAHFSICNENTMDVFHGYLHRGLQGWFDPVLINLKQKKNKVYAEYKVSYQGLISKFLNLSKDKNQVTTRTISIEYNYPHYHSTLEGLSSLYLMRSPVSKTETKSFSLLFLKLKLPQFIIKLLKGQISSLIWHFLFKKFLDQDVEMVESEQKTYFANPHRKYVEINPAIIALQRVNIQQYEEFIKDS